MAKAPTDAPKDTASPPDRRSRSGLAASRAQPVKPRVGDALDVAHLVSDCPALEIRTAGVLVDWPCQNTPREYQSALT